jgi:DNA-binding beta-propeller fold protein YncE
MKPTAQFHYVGLLLLFSLTATCAYSQESGSIRGHIYNAASCEGISNLTLRLTVPKKSQYNAELIATTDAHGDFQFGTQAFGSYYLAVFDGANQVYGHVVNFRNQNVVMIALEPSRPGPAKLTSGCLTPVALALSTSSGSLFVLDAKHGILRYSLSELDLAPEIVAQFTSSWQAIDMATAVMAQQDHIFVTLIEGSVGQLMQYSASGQFETSWYQSAPLTGVCTDEKSAVVYVAALRPLLLLQQSFSEPKQPLKNVFRFSNVQDLGPLAVDEDAKTLYVGDPVSGQVLVFDPAAAAIRQTVSGVGQPTAMAFDSRNKQLFITDSGGHRVWVVALAPVVGKPKVFLDSNLFKSPSAIAIAPDGSVWVGDQSAHVILEFSSSGALVKTIR